MEPAGAGAFRGYHSGHVKFDALGHRIQEINSSLGIVHDLYFSAAWQVLEERKGALVRTQNVWSPVYVDAMILRDRDPSGGGTLNERRYVQQDANFNVTALVDTSGSPAERYVYDPYGTRTALNPTWQPTDPTVLGMMYLHQGGRFDSLSGLYNFRNRDLSPTLGRWMQVDPIGYLGGINLYEYVGNSPIDYTDSTGLSAAEKICLAIVKALKGKTCNQLWSFCGHIGRHPSDFGANGYKICLTLYDVVCLQGDEKLTNKILREACKCTYGK